MAFLIIGPHSQATIDDADEALFRMPEKYDLEAPECGKLWRDFYADPKMTSVKQVEQFRAEILAIRGAYQKERRLILMREKKINAKDPIVVSNVLDQLIKDDRWLAKFAEIIKVCDESIRAGEGLDFSSD